MFLKGQFVVAAGSNTRSSYPSIGKKYIVLLTRFNKERSYVLKKRCTCYLYPLYIIEIWYFHQKVNDFMA